MKFVNWNRIEKKLGTVHSFTAKSSEKIKCFTASKKNEENKKKLFRSPGSGCVSLWFVDSKQLSVIFSTQGDSFEAPNFSDNGDLLFKLAS